MAPGNTAQEKAINGTINGLGSADQNHPIRSWVHKLFQVYICVRARVCVYVICYSDSIPTLEDNHKLNFFSGYFDE